MYQLQFLKPYGELLSNVESMPIKDKDKKKVALWFCRNNGPIPGECLQVGLLILRTLDQNSFTFSKCQSVLVFEAVLEWIKACSPEQPAIDMIIGDLRECYPMTHDVLERILKDIGKENSELVLASARVPTRIRTLVKEPIV